MTHKHALQTLIPISQLGIEALDSTSLIFKFVKLFRLSGLAKEGQISIRFEITQACHYTKGQFASLSSGTYVLR